MNKVKLWLEKVFPDYILITSKLNRHKFYVAECIDPSHLRRVFDPQGGCRLECSPVYVVIDTYCVRHNIFEASTATIVDSMEKAYDKFPWFFVSDSAPNKGCLQNSSPVPGVNNTELTKTQIQILTALNALGYHWITKDKSGKVYLYTHSPIKLESYWIGKDGYSVALCDLPTAVDFLFTLVSWSDTEPLSINLLLANKDGSVDCGQSLL